MYIKRTMMDLLKKAATQFPVVALIGPRQSGKTTLARHAFPTYTYVSLENLDTQALAKNDPRKFLTSFLSGEGVIIDEIQEVPELFSYMQGIVDEEKKQGFFIITGSQNFLMYEKITQTLAGRIALLTLLPLSLEELKEAGKLPSTPDEVIVKGLYPRLYTQTNDFELWYSNYIATYVERDVRQVLQISDVLNFQKFLRLCAARVGNLINFAELARDADISPHTAKAWISVLEMSYIVKLIQPYHKNFNKRVIKGPKLYFYDVGLACNRLGIRTVDDLNTHPMRGPLFENMMIVELYKHYTNKGYNPPIYFWRDVQGHEMDCVVERSYNQLTAIEIKSGMTIRSDFFKSLEDWKKITGNNTPSYVIYGGTQKYDVADATVVPWNDLSSITSKL